jgi:hypothetical protein
VPSVSYRAPRLASLLVALGGLSVVWASVGDWGIHPFGVAAETVVNRQVATVAYPAAAAALAVALRGWRGDEGLLALCCGVACWLVLVAPTGYQFVGGPLKLLLGGLFVVLGSLLGQYRDAPLAVGEAVPERPRPPLDGWVAFGACLVVLSGFVPLDVLPGALVRHPARAVALVLVVAAGAGWCLYLWGPGLRVVTGLVGAAALFLVALPADGSAVGTRRAAIERAVLAGGTVFVTLASADLLRRATGTVRTPSDPG